MKIRIFLKSTDNSDLNIAVLILDKFFTTNKINKISQFISLPSKIKRFCVLRSPHADKDSREHFEIIYNKRFIDIELNNLIILDSLINTQIPSSVYFSFEFLNK